MEVMTILQIRLPENHDYSDTFVRTVEPYQEFKSFFKCLIKHFQKRKSDKERRIQVRWIHCNSLTRKFDPVCTKIIEEKAISIALFFPNGFSSFKFNQSITLFNHGITNYKNIYIHKTIDTKNSNKILE